MGGAGGAVAQIPHATGDRTGRGIGQIDRDRRRARGFVRAEAGDRGRNGHGLADFVGESTFVPRAVIGFDRKIISRAVGQVGYRGSRRVADIYVGRVITASGSVIHLITADGAGAGIPGQIDLTCENVR